ncbi:hypothetical protein [Dyadobacter soli]|uniref:hypothetical protein n=1 Tax=Dyadobacter soli TaxID=659014 RepID=UPI00115FA9F1|nr:hypothetical protein [Dyadobacter soli]
MRAGLIRRAAINNAKWCSIVCQANGALGVFKDQAWYSVADVPMYYPNIVTLKASCNWHLVESIAKKIQGKASLKDSFDTLQLPASKYEKLFGGKWFVAKSIKLRRSRYEIVRSVGTLKDWEEAISDKPTVSKFNYKVLSHPAVRIIAVKKGDKITGGCVLTRSNEVVGLTNFFYPEGMQDDYWLICLSAARIFAGKASVVGYMRDDLLHAIMPASTMELGPLSVWSRKES